MSKFTPSWAFKGNELHAHHVQTQPADGQQQNGEGGQQRTEPSTAPTPPLMESHGVDATFSNPYNQNTIKAGATENPSSYGGESYPSATPGPDDNQQFRTNHYTGSAERPERANSRGYHPHQQEEKRPEMKSEHYRSAEKTNESEEVKDRDNNQMIRSTSMSTRSQHGKVPSRSQREERTFAPADPPASGLPQYNTPQVSRPKSRTEVTPQGGLGGTVVAYIVVPDKQVPCGVNLPYNQNTKESPSQEPGEKAQGTQMDQVATGGGLLTAPTQEVQEEKKDLWYYLSCRCC